MYLENINLLIVDIPKNGSKTLKRAAQLAGHTIMFPGHYTYKESMEKIGATYGDRRPDVAYVVRKPQDRFVSAVQFLYKGHYDQEKFMDELIEHLKSGTISSLGRAARHAFTPQFHYIHGAKHAKMFPMEKIGELCRRVGFLFHTKTPPINPCIGKLFYHIGGPKKF